NCSPRCARWSRTRRRAAGLRYCRSREVGILRRMTEPFIVAIPARYASTRLPGKPLLPLAGEPMIAHVVRRAQAAGAGRVVRAADGSALYFSRAPLPWARDAFAKSRENLPAQMPFLRHIGIYAYRAGFLRRFTQLAPTPLERAESLEQLRALEHGHRIAVRIAP